MAVAIVEAISNTLAKLIDALLGNTVAWLCITAVLVVFLLRADPKVLTAESLVVVLESAKGFVETSLWGIIGWLLALVVMCIAGPVIYVQQRRLKAQGEITYALRGGPDRLSAGNENALDIDNESLKKRFPAKKEE